MQACLTFGVGRRSNCVCVCVCEVCVRVRMFVCVCARAPTHVARQRERTSVQIMSRRTAGGGGMRLSVCAASVVLRTNERELDLPYRFCPGCFLFSFCSFATALQGLSLTSFCPTTPPSQPPAAHKAWRVFLLEAEVAGRTTHT